MPALLYERLDAATAAAVAEGREPPLARYRTERPLEYQAIERQLRQEVAGVKAQLDWYRPRGAAAQLATATDDEVLLAGPAGTGKSLGCLMRIFELACRHPGARFLIVRKTAKSLTSSALVTWRTKVAARAMAAGFVDFYGGSAQEPAQYRFQNGSRVLLAGMDSADKVMSTEFDLVFVQEAIELVEGDWEALTTRLRNGVLPHMQMLADTNPSAPSHWLRARAQRGTLRILESRHEDNPVLFTDTGELTPAGATYIARLDALTGVRHKRLRLGLWVSAEGIIYEGWDPAVHLVDPFAIPADWDRYWTVDFGYTNPTVVQFWAQDPDGRLWLYREHVQTQRLVEDHARALLGYVTDSAGSWLEPRPKAVICDHDAEGRATLSRHLGLPTSPARKDVATGIEAMQVRLRPAGDGRPRLLVFRDALTARDPAMDEAKLPVGLAEEIEGYVWARSPDGRPVKEDPVKVNDHSMDAARYTVAYFDLGGRPRIRTFG